MTADPAKRRRDPSRHRRRAEATRDKLLNAARAVFAEKGLDLASIDDITRRADVGKGTFYYHFSGRGEIVQALMARVLNELIAVMEDSCRGITDLREVLDALIGAHIRFFCNRWEDFVLFFQGRSDLTLEQSYEQLKTPFVEYLQRVGRLLAPATNYGLTAPALRRIACAVAGFVSGYYSFAVIGSQDEDLDGTFSSLRGAMVASLARFIQEAAPSAEPKEPSVSKA
jgi:AcrR family transcriptional regulator